MWSDNWAANAVPAGFLLAHTIAYGLLLALDELASYCLHALTAAGSQPSKPRSTDSSGSLWLETEVSEGLVALPPSLDEVVGELADQAA